MAMRMPPQVAQQTALPAVNRTSLVLFAGLALILLNLFWVNGGGIIAAIFHPGSSGVQFTQLSDTGWQVLGLGGLTLAANYGGENAGTAALLFIGALWILWLIAHRGTAPAAEQAATSPSEGASTNTSTNTNPTAGGSGGQKK